jgi:hypothetical protein
VYDRRAGELTAPIVDLRCREIGPDGESAGDLLGDERLMSRYGLRLRRCGGFEQKGRRRERQKLNMSHEGLRSQAARDVATLMP